MRKTSVIQRKGAIQLMDRIDPNHKFPDAVRESMICDIIRDMRYYANLKDQPTAVQLYKTLKERGLKNIFSFKPQDNG